MASCTDTQFIDLWRMAQSATKVADALGIAVRNAHARRQRVEARYGIVLPVLDERRPQYNTVEIKHKARMHMELRDGICMVGSDAHIWSGDLTPAMRAFLKFIRELKPKHVHLNGDVFDGAKISRHPKIGFLESAPTIKQELDACREVITKVEDAARGADKVWEFGNHDLRLEAYLAARVPEYEGVKGFHLKDWFPNWKPCWSCHINPDTYGHTVIKHRLKGGKFDVANNIQTAHTNIVTGHTHALKWWPTTTYRSTTLYGVNTGTLAHPSGEQFVHYTEDNPVDWRAGFAVLTFHKGRLLMPELVEVIGVDEVMFRGKVLKV